MYRVSRRYLSLYLFHIEYITFFCQDNRDLSFPILFYLLEGRRDIIENASNSVLKLYKTFLEKDVDMGETRYLIILRVLSCDYQES